MDYQTWKFYLVVKTYRCQLQWDTSLKFSVWHKRDSHRFNFRHTTHSERTKRHGRIDKANNHCSKSFFHLGTAWLFVNKFIANIWYYSAKESRELKYTHSMIDRRLVRHLRMNKIVWKFLSLHVRLNNQNVSAPNIFQITISMIFLKLCQNHPPSINQHCCTRLPLRK